MHQEETIDTKKGKKISKIISDMHLDISETSDVESPHGRGYSIRYYEEIIATPGPDKDKEDNDKYFVMFRDILSNSLRLEYKDKDKDLLEEKSFIYLAKLNNDGYTYDANEKLGLKEYLDIIEGSESFINYNQT